MKLKNLKISKLINIWLGITIFIMMVFFASSLVSIESLWSNTENLYNHPLVVRRAVGHIEADVLYIHRNMISLSLADDQQEVDDLLLSIVIYEEEINRNIDILNDRYLGSKSDIVELTNDLAVWKTIRIETVRLYSIGNVDEVIERVKSDGIGGAQAFVVISKVGVISDFALLKGDEFYEAAKEQRQQNVIVLTVLFASFTLLVFGIGYTARNGILPPLKLLVTATGEMNQGKFDTRVQYESTNEMGILSMEFNQMANTIEVEMAFKNNLASISSVMTRQDTLRGFCQDLLKNLLISVDAQIAAIYFLNKETNRFEHYESIGTKIDYLPSFSIEKKEGEFGAAIATKNIQHLTDIPSDIQLVYSTVSGDFKVREIITIPIINESDVTSVISIASIKCISPVSVRLIHSLVGEISARLDSLLTSQQILEYSQKLQGTNAELEQQSKELEMQKNELAQQNVELEMQKSQLNEATRLKSSFLSNMSHELRTPLNSVIALSGVLNRRLANKIPDEEYSYLEIIERNGKNLLSLVNDVLDLSRIEAGHEEFEITKFNLNLAISDLVTTLEPIAKRKNIKLNHETKNSNISINTDANKLRHILQNLLDNAVKFTEKGKVSIIARQLTNHIEIKVSDTGIGISKENLPLVFNEFKQADDSISRRYGGTGLGLAIVKKYVNLLGGTISVKSVLNEGSEFTVSLPIDFIEVDKFVNEDLTADLKNKIKPQPSQVIQGLSNKNILLVEDNESAIIQINDLVEEMGYKLTTACDGGKALEMIGQSIPDAIILDLMMPGIDGFKVLEILRNEDSTAHVPVLILSAKHITKEELKFLKRNNVHELIQKGNVNREELHKSIYSMLFPETIKTKQPQRQPQSIKGKPVVLIVEDNPDNMITVKALLKDHYTILEAIDAHQGINLAKEFVPNLILMDIGLPGMNGIQAFHEIRTIPELQHIPIVALTASVMLHDRQIIMANGFDAFVAKPINEEEVLTLISEVLYGKEKD